MAVRTAKQKAALRKAQLASARKRRGKGKGSPAKKGISRRRKVVGGAMIAGGYAAMTYGAYKLHKSNQRSNRRSEASIRINKRKLKRIKHKATDYDMRSPKYKSTRGREVQVQTRNGKNTSKRTRVRSRKRK